MIHLSKFESRRNRVVVDLAGNPFIQKGGYVFDVENARWYRIQGFQVFHVDTVPMKMVETTITAEAFTMMTMITKPCRTCPWDHSASSSEKILRILLQQLFLSRSSAEILCITRI